MLSFLFTSLCLRACFPLTPTQLTCYRQNLKCQFKKFFLNGFFPILKTTREAKSLCYKELFLLKNCWLEVANSIRKQAKIAKVRGRVKRPHPTPSIYLGLRVYLSPKYFVQKFSEKFILTICLYQLQYQSHLH